MYEAMTFEAILKRMLDRVPADLDKREGSVLYTALAPAAVELTNLYLGLDWVMDQSFADTQGREYLIRRCAERGIAPKAATYAVLKGAFNRDVPVGSRFSLDMFNYTAVEKISDGIFRMRCETIGAEGNRRLGAMIPINYIPGLTRAELTEVLIPGEDEEGTESLRSRYFESLHAQAFGGNVADYREKVKALPGVGGVKVYPVWNGGGTVKLAVISSEFQAPSGELLAQVKEAIDPAEQTGKGYGLAPIGHTVTVEGVETVPVSIHTSLTYKSGWSLESCREGIFLAVDEYFSELNHAWEERERIVVRVSQIESRLLDLEGILDVADTALNGAAGNLELSENGIAVRGEFDGAGS